MVHRPGSDMVQWRKTSREGGAGAGKKREAGKCMKIKAYNAAQISYIEV